MPERTLIATQLLKKRMIDEKRQPEFAIELSVCEKTVRELEKSKANPRLKTLKRIAAIMRKSISSFFELKPVA